MLNIQITGEASRVTGWLPRLLLLVQYIINGTISLFTFFLLIFLNSTTA